MVSYLIENVSEELWEKFKATLTKDKTINEAFIEMIDKRVRGGGK